ncbi:hypothetical protein K1719_043967 [Acacia pycnantha]|nr:hypothetical protein K1719_043967 [Acacia pycnantha]
MSLNNVRVNISPIYNDGFIVIYGIEKFFDPNFKYTAPNRNSSCGVTNETASSRNSLKEVVKALNAGGYSVMASFLGFQTCSPINHHKTLLSQNPNRRCLYHRYRHQDLQQPLQFYNIETAQSLGDQLGTFIRYDAKSHLNCYGLRFQVLVSKLGLKSINLNRFQLLAGLNVKMSLVLERVGRLCYSYMNIGHTARNCMDASNFQSQHSVSVMGSRSVSVKYDFFLLASTFLLLECGVFEFWHIVTLERYWLKRLLEAMVHHITRVGSKGTYTSGKHHLI